MGGSRHASGGSTNVDELGELVDEVHEDERVFRDNPAQLGGVGDVVVGAGEKGDADYAEGNDGATEETQRVNTQQTKRVSKFLTIMENA